MLNELGNPQGDVIFQKTMKAFVIIYTNDLRFQLNRDRSSASVDDIFFFHLDNIRQSTIHILVSRRVSINNR